MATMLARDAAILGALALAPNSILEGKLISPKARRIGAALRARDGQGFSKTVRDAAFQLKTWANPKLREGSFKMKEPGLDGRHRDLNGKIDSKRADALNGNLSKPIPGFRSDATVGHMRKVTGMHSLAGIRQAKQASKR